MPKWEIGFAHFLAHFGNVKNRWNRARKKCSTVPLWAIFAKETTHFKKGLPSVYCEKIILAFAPRICEKSYFCKTNLYSNISVFSSNGYPYFCQIFVASILPRLPSWDLSWTEDIKRRRQGNISTSFLRRGGKIFPRVCFLFIFNVKFLFDSIEPFDNCKTFTSHFYCIESSIKVKQG